MGKVAADEVTKILNLALQNGINTLDTASLYGSSEAVLGRTGISKWNVISKLSPLPRTDLNIDLWVRGQVANSLKLLKQPNIQGFLVHNSSQLIDVQGDEIWAALGALKTEGIIKKIGVSVYDFDELEILLKRYDFDIVQCPYNILDRRLETSGCLQKMFTAGVEVHARSIFLQGLLLMTKPQRPAQFNAWSQLWSQLDDWYLENEISPLEGCFNFGLCNDKISKVIIGIDTASHLKQIIAIKRRANISFPENFSLQDVKLINPSSWIK